MGDPARRNFNAYYGTTCLTGSGCRYFLKASSSGGVFRRVPVQDVPVTSLDNKKPVGSENKR